MNVLYYSLLISTLLQFTYKKRYPFSYTQTDHQPHISVTYFFLFFFINCHIIVEG